MSDWTAGYVADIGYTFGYYSELNPQRIKLAFLNAGLAFPEIGAACELGFGQGLSTNIHAAASIVSWHATDFNPAQAGFARQLAAASGANAHLFDDAFADFARRPELPDFDFIGLHGIWSWISDENRAVIVDFIRRKLKVGGVLYISYNTQPGWAAMVPMRDLLTEHFDVMGVAGQGVVPRIDGAITFAEKLLATNPLYARSNPSVVERLKGIKAQNRNYVAHEYFNRDWLPMPFSSMARWLAPARLSFATSAHFLDHVDAINVTGEQQGLLHEIPDAMFRQSVRDFMVNQQFRRDYWVKGARKLNALEQSEALRAQRVVLLQPRADVSLTLTAGLGEAKMQATVYAPILDALATHQPTTLGQIEHAISGQGITFAQLVQAVVLLTGTGSLSAVQDDAAISRAKPYTARLNAALCDTARGSNDISYLASPVSGGGIGVSRFHQLFLLAIDRGKEQPVEWAQLAWEILASQGQMLLKEGKPLETAEANLTELTALAADFAVKPLPILKALQIG
ncbi:class I SAM-dependent methyltransferase [Candidatus Accumulibacter contiguus]|jgi:SAM-dependent methyltransferase|uniref:Methyltransferase n=1 Tax=Candidatus Accumulibacter contiguus TaxID=2954381 RepID=A0ABX1TEH9_9PROT|nr:class I SAM-dependent methyltransferase [Candidatus Accumulibacter contiguus]NMQ07232.1 methyltransferase [Candidatus Accumulibacter contiguus]